MSALLVLTDSTGIESIYANETVRPVVISQRDEACSQILYVDVETLCVEAVVLLNDEQPFNRVPLSKDLQVVQPNVCEILDFIEPFQIITSDLYAKFMECPRHWDAPLKTNEAFRIQECDIYGPIDPEEVCEEIVEQFTVHRSCASVSRAVAWMKGEGRDVSSRVSEFIATEYQDGGFDSIEELPRNWEAAMEFAEDVTPEQKEVKKAHLISLLNSMNEPFVIGPATPRQ